MIAETVFLISFILLAYTFIVYPVCLIIADRYWNINSPSPHLQATLPKVSVLMAVRNEESILKEKINALFSSDYPGELLEVIVGSDCSDDNTDTILKELSAVHGNLRTVHFKERTGKPGIINSLSQYATGEIFIITDANVIPSKNTVRLLAGKLANNEADLADSRLTVKKKEGTSFPLPGDAYINFETKIKIAEGNLWGMTMGPFGGFYAMKRSFFTINPDNTLADDFRICMNVLEKDGRAVTVPEATVSEDITSDLSVEFTRKTRIAAGNFQNLAHFSYLFLKPWKKLFLVYFSHKVLRWIAPFIWLGMVTSLALLAPYSILYRVLLNLQLIFIILPPLDLILRKLRLNVAALRFITHFTLLNVSLVAGFIRYISGIKDGTWTPTRREKEYEGI